MMTMARKNMMKMESNSFKNLEELVLVNVPVLKHLWNNPNQIVSLSNLSSITIRNCGLGSLAIAMDSLLQLQDLWIDSCSMMEQVFSSKRDGNKSRITFPQLKSLKLFNLESLTTFCQEVGSIEFPMLTGIKIKNCPRITSLVSSIENNQNSASTHLFCSQQVTFGRLKCLGIKGCNNISKIWCHQISDNFFTELEQLDISKCDSIKSLFSSAIARNLASLKVLEIERCKEMVKVIGDEDEIIGETKRPLLSLFPRLEDLRLESLPKLESFCEWRYDLELPMLHSLTIRGYPMMKVFTMGSLISAHKFEHIECPKLTSVESSMGTNGDNDDTSPLFCIRKIPDSFFTGLKALQIVECNSIRSLFSSTIARNLANLILLEIERCKEIGKVIGDEEEITGKTDCPLLSLFPKLEDLTLDSLPKLGSFCELRCDLELPMLHFLTIRGCPMMKVFTMGSLISTPNLIDTEIENQDKGVGDLNELMRLHSYTEGGDIARAEIGE